MTAALTKYRHGNVTIQYPDRQPHAHHLIRINPRDPKRPRCISLLVGGLKALQAIDGILFNRQDAEDAEGDTA